MVEGFVGYVGEADFHDAVVRTVAQHGDMVVVTLDATTGRKILVEFSRVQSLKGEGAEGMTIYSVSEMEAPLPLRRFVFVNWDEEDDSRALEIVAHAIAWRDVAV